MKDRVDLEERRVLAEARTGLAPTREQIDRMLARTRSQLQQQAVPADRAQLTAANRLLEKSLAVLGCLVAAAALGVYFARSRPPVEPLRPTPAPVAVRPPLPAIELAPEPCRDCVPSAETRPPQPRRVTRALPDPDFELRALRRVERALRDDAPRRALSLLRELDRRVPGGQLREERVAAAIVARCVLDAASRPALLAQFMARHSDSVYLPRVAQSCADKSKREVGALDK